MPTAVPQPTFTVLTPTYNRAHTLVKVYECLERQTFRDFEWLIVDDGSSDSTNYLVTSWLKGTDLAIRYIKQPNGGKHTALNRGIQEAKGEFTTILDSDDILEDDALERFLAAWQSIPEDQRQNYCGVAGLCQDEKGKILGHELPQTTLDSDAIEITYTYRLGDDRHGMNRTEVLRQFPFPVFQGERFLTESVVWNRLALEYKIRYINQVVCIKEYLEGGLTRSFVKLATRNPKGMALYYQELSRVKRPLALGPRAWFNACFVRYALHGRTSLADIVQAANKLWLVPAFIAGLALYWRDLQALKRLEQATIQPSQVKNPTTMEEVE
jgi:glycosyltransferase involved in cell wall biosynthesis